MTPDTDTVSSILRAHYPSESIAGILESGAELPTVSCPPWWKPLARRRWIRDMNGRIAFARVYGWRTNLGPARHHTFVSKFERSKA